jgi:hypothetical protein
MPDSGEDSEKVLEFRLTARMILSEKMRSLLAEIRNLQDG